MEIGLCISALGLVLLGDSFPVLLSGGATCKTDFGGIGKALREQVTHHRVLILPCFGCIDLSIRQIACILWLRAGFMACEVGPLMHGLHHFLEVHHKDGPVGAIGFKVGDADRENQRSRHNVVGTILATMTEA